MLVASALVKLRPLGFHRWWRRVLADGLVGTWAWVGRLGVTGTNSRHAARFQRVGEGTAFGFPPGPTMGQRWIRIGAKNIIGPDVVLAAGMWPDEPFVPERGWSIQIGDRCNIGRGTGIVGRVGIEIGDDVTFAPNVYVTDHNHDYAEPDLPIKVQWIIEEPVVIGSGCWLGIGAVILPGTQLGRNVAVAAGSVVRGVVPDCSVVAGMPARVIRQWDAETETWDPPIPADRGADAAGVPPGWYEEVAKELAG